MEKIDEAKLASILMDVKPEDMEVFLSSDGKNTVHVKNAQQVEMGIQLFDFLKELYGTKQAQAKKEYNAEEDFGKCKECGAPNTRYKKSGKIGCSAYCWRK